jgi:hypothetical protein
MLCLRHPKEWWKFCVDHDLGCQNEVVYFVRGMSRPVCAACYRRMFPKDDVAKLTMEEYFVEKAERDLEGS